MHTVLNVHTTLVGLPQNRHGSCRHLYGIHSQLINHANNHKDKYLTLTQELLDGLYFSFIRVISFDILTNYKFFSLFLHSLIL